MNTKYKSLSINAALNIMRVISTILIPLCVTPYVARVLGVTAMGKVNFGNAIVEYFSLLASLGVYSYAVREGTAVRNNQQKINRFASEIYRLNFLTMLGASVLLLLCCTFVPKVSAYVDIIGFQAANVAFTILGAEWLYAVYEDYVYIMVRTFIIQAFSMICIFLFIKEPQHIHLYLLIIMLSGFLTCMINYFRRKRYCHISLLRVKINRKQIRPILYIFASTLASTVYTNIDITMIGVIEDDYQVGIYSMAVKICSVFKQIIFAGIDVTMPRLSYIVRNDPRDYEKNLVKIIHMIVLLVVPLISGAMIQRENIIWVLLGGAYEEAESSLAILFIAVLAAIAAYFVMHTILLPLGMEKILLKATIYGALSNVALNGVMIPLMGIKGAATATVLSELIVFFISFCCVRGKIRIQISKKLISLIVVSDVAMMGSLMIIKQVIDLRGAELALSVIGGIAIYFGGIASGKKIVMKEFGFK